MKKLIFIVTLDKNSGELYWIGVTQRD